MSAEQPATLASGSTPTQLSQSCWRAEACAAAVTPATTPTSATIAHRMRRILAPPSCPLPTAHCRLIRRRLIALQNALARLVHVALEHEQVVGFPHRVGEVVLLAALDL